MRYTKNTYSLIFAAALLTSCTSRHWQATRSDNNLMAEPSGLFVPTSKNSDANERFSLGCKEKGNNKGKLALDARLKKDHRFVMTSYHNLFDKKSLEKNEFIVTTTADNYIELKVDGDDIVSIQANTESNQISEVKTKTGKKTKITSRYDVNDVPTTTKCVLETSDINSEKDLTDRATAVDGIYEFYTEYPKRGRPVRATRLNFEANGIIHCDGQEIGHGKVTLVEYHSNEVPSPDGILHCGGTKIFQSKKIIAGNGQVLEHFRQEIIEAPNLD